MKKNLSLLMTLMLLTMAAAKAQQVSVVYMHNDSIKTCYAQFYDAGGESANYPNNESDTLTFYPIDPAQKICVTFHSFNTQVANDFLYIYDGKNTNAPLINNLNGTVNFGTIKSTSPDGSLTFRFQSDATIPGQGWSATISVDTVPDVITMLTGINYYNTSFHVSKGKFFDNGGATGNYSDNMSQSTLTLFPTNTNDKLSISFDIVDIAAGDYLYVFNGPVVGVNQIARITGQNKGTVNSTAPDGSLTFQFQSATSAAAAGWIATISVNNTPEDITMIADGIFKVSKGRFFDNGGPAMNYTHDKDAVVTLLPENANDKVSVTFHEFNLNTGDYLQVFNGTTQSTASLLATLTGFNYGTIRSSSPDGALTFKFHSDLTSNSEGWSASIATDYFIPEDITMIANGSFKVENFGRFYDNGGSYNNYSANQKVKTTVYPANTSDKLTATFHMFSLGTGDTLFAYNGNDTTQALLGTFTGLLNRFEITSTATDGSLTFRFVSNATIFSYGWYANLVTTAGLPVYNMTMNQTVTDTTDGGYFYDSGGANASYSDNELTSIKTFVPATPGKKISVSFAFFSTHSANDYLFVYDGPTEFAPLIGKFYKSGAYGTVRATTNSGELTFKFISDGSIPEKGWAALVTTDTVPKIISLPGTYVLPSGTTAFYYDESGPEEDYSNSKDFITTIKPQNSGDRITISFTSFLTHVSGDYLEIHDGALITDPLLTTLNFGSGYGSITASAANATGSLTFRFVTNSNNESKGWAAVVSTDTTHKNISLPGKYYVNSGIFTDAGGNYYEYINEMDAVTTIAPINAGEKISIDFTYFTTHASADYLEIRDGNSVTDTLLATLFENGGYGPVTATNPAGSLTFRFVSSTNNTQTGWSGVISSNASFKNFALPGTYILPSGTSGFFYDAGGPENDYIDAMDAVTTIKPADSTEKITVAFNKFITYSASDYLEIYEGVSVAGAPLATLSGTVSPISFTSQDSTGSFTFRFVSNGTFHAAGWVAGITADPCFLSTVGIPKSNYESAGLSAYPNPSSGVFYFESSDSRIERLEVFNILGEKITGVENPEDGKVMIDLTQQIPGLYIVKAETKNGSVIQKVMKQ